MRPWLLCLAGIVVLALRFGDVYAHFRIGSVSGPVYFVRFNKMLFSPPYKSFFRKKPRDIFDFQRIVERLRISFKSLNPTQQRKKNCQLKFTIEYLLRRVREGVSNSTCSWKAAKWVEKLSPDSRYRFQVQISNSIDSSTNTDKTYVNANTTKSVLFSYCRPVPNPWRILR